MTKIAHYGVIGSPIAHSLSPHIHALFARQTDQAMTYRAIEVAGDALARDLPELFRQGMAGLNVTVPHKLNAATLCAEISHNAQRAGAVNTLVQRADGSLYGDTTDGAGLVYDLTRNLALTLKGASVLIIGAGGSVFSVLGALLDEQPARVVVANRTRATADRLVAKFQADGNVTSSGLDSIPDVAYDLVINATSATLDGEVPPIPPGVVRDAHCYDLMYGANGTPFTGWCMEKGARALSTGIGMLIEQAALSFEIWRGVRPDTAAVRSALEKRYGFSDIPDDAGSQ